MTKLTLELEEVIALQKGLEILLGDEDFLWSGEGLEWQLEHLLYRVNSYLDEDKEIA